MKTQHTYNRKRKRNKMDHFDQILKEVENEAKQKTNEK